MKRLTVMNSSIVGCFFLISPCIFKDFDISELCFFCTQYFVIRFCKYKCSVNFRKNTNNFNILAQTNKTGLHVNEKYLAKRHTYKNVRIIECLSEAKVNFYIC